jgi:hypothetical protein
MRVLYIVEIKFAKRTKFTEIKQRDRLNCSAFGFKYLD